MCLRFLMKFVLVLINFLLTLVGLGVIAVGVIVILALSSGTDYAELEEVTKYIDLTVFQTAAYVVIGIGAVLFLIAFCGCCGACCENKCMLITYAVCMGVLAAIKVYIIVQIFYNLDTYKGEINNLVNKAFEMPVDLDEISNPSIPSDVTVPDEVAGIIESNQFNATVGNVLEMALQCCGTTGPDYYNITNDLLPPTCCVISNATNNINVANISLNPSTPYEQYVDDSVLSQYTCRKEDAFEEGCSTLIEDLFGKYAVLVGQGIIIILVAELVEILFAALLSTNCCKTK